MNIVSLRLSEMPIKVTKGGVCYDRAFGQPLRHEDMTRGRHEYYEAFDCSKQVQNSTTSTRYLDAGSRAHNSLANPP